MPVFSFRAECAVDVNQFKRACKAAGLVVQWTLFPEPQFPDVQVEIDAQASLEALQQVARKVVDGHVMLQTLRECPLTENSLERDYDLD